MNAVLVLLDQVLLLATLVGMFGHDLGSGSLSVVGNIEKRFGIGEQSCLPLMNFEALPDNDDAIISIAGVRTIIKLGNMLDQQANIRELTVHHRDHNHDNNPNDGSNWELLCLYCHDNEHQRQLEAAGLGKTTGSGKSTTTSVHNPFAALKGLLKDKD